jgi:hypothetical protein
MVLKDELSTQNIRDRHSSDIQDGQDAGMT